MSLSSASSAETFGSRSVVRHNKRWISSELLCFAWSKGHGTRGKDIIFLP